MKIKKFKIILSLFLIIGIAAGGVLGYYDARLEAAVNNKNGSTLTDVRMLLISYWLDLIMERSKVITEDLTVL